jgi:hypothetical protein
MAGEIFISLLLILVIVIAFGFFYLWLLWIIADWTNP